MEKRFLGKVVLSSIGAFFVFNIYASETLEVCVKVDTSKIVRKTDITNDDLARFGRFGIKAPPFDEYYSVISAPYIDRFGNDYVELKKDLTKHIPSGTYSTSLSVNERNKFKFPKYVSKSFINSVEKHQIEGKSFSQKIYKQKQFGKEVHLQYSIEYADTSNKKIIIPNEITQSSQPLVSDSDSFLDFDLISLLYFMIGEK